VIDRSIKKAIFLVLLVILSGVWGYNIYQMVPSGGSEFYKRVDKSVDDKNVKRESKPSDIAFGNEYKEDPFEPFFTRINIKQISTVTKKGDPITPPRIRYIGLIKDKNRTKGIIEIGNGITEIVEKNEELFEIKILNLDEENVKFRYKGKVFSAVLGE